MKKLFLFFAVLLGCALTVSAGDTYAHDASVLPMAARSTIDNTFKAKVSLVKIEKTLGRVTEYEVILTDGSEICFDRDGNWKSVETNKSKSVPSTFIPKTMREHLNRYHKGVNIVGIEKDRGGYEVELANGMDIKYNKDGSFKRYDD